MNQSHDKIEERLEKVTAAKKELQTKDIDPWAKQQLFAAYDKIERTLNNRRILGIEVIGATIVSENSSL